MSAARDAMRQAKQYGRNASQQESGPTCSRKEAGAQENAQGKEREAGASRPTGCPYSSAAASASLQELQELARTHL